MAAAMLPAGVPAVVTPGQRLCRFRGRTAGRGVCVRSGFLVATMVGRAVCGADDVVSVRPFGGGDATVTPTVGDVVTARVVRVTPTFARVAIVCVGAAPLRDNFRGTIRCVVMNR